MYVHQDHRYIVALVQHDSALIREIYERYSDMVRQLVLRNNGTEEDAADVMQESLLAISRQAVNNNLVLTCPLGAFLYRVAKGRWLNELKKKHRQPVTIADVEGFSSDGDQHPVALAEQTLNADRRESLFWEKFQELGERCRELLQLSWMGNSMEKVAEQMGVTYGYARKKKTECITRLVELVQKSGEYENLRKWMLDG